VKTFLLDTVERAVRAFAAALLGAFTASETVATIHWPAALAMAGTAALVSVLLSLVSIPISGSDRASLLPASPTHGRHEATTPERNDP
jgi:hypothetical protein